MSRHIKPQVQVAAEALLDALHCGYTVQHVVEAAVVASRSTEEAKILHGPLMALRNHETTDRLNV